LETVAVKDWEACQNVYDTSLRLRFWIFIIAQHLYWHITWIDLLWSDWSTCIIVYLLFSIAHCYAELYDIKYAICVRYVAILSEWILLLVDTSICHDWWRSTWLHVSNIQPSMDVPNVESHKGNISQYNILRKGFRHTNTETVKNHIILTIMLFII
jgi:hypothetical protein